MKKTVFDYEDQIEKNRKTDNKESSRKWWRTSVSSEERCEQQQAICAGECLFHSGEQQETNWSCWWQLGPPPPQRSPFHHPAAALHYSSSRTPQVEQQQEQPVWPFQLPAPGFLNFCKKVLQTLPPQICFLKPRKPLSSPLLAYPSSSSQFSSATSILFCNCYFLFCNSDAATTISTSKYQICKTKDESLSWSPSGKLLPPTPEEYEKPHHFQKTYKFQIHLNPFPCNQKFFVPQNQKCLSLQQTQNLSATQTKCLSLQWNRGKKRKKSKPLGATCSWEEVACWIAV